MSLREKKKQRILQEILNAASELFLTRGYEKTSLEAIAEKADIGVGTVYNYFKSKADIFIAVMADEFELKKNDAILPENEAELNTPDLIITYIGNVTLPLQNYSKDMWKEIFAVVFGNLKKEDNLLGGFIQLDSQFILKLQDLFEEQKKKGAAPADFKSEEAAQIIYSILLTQFVYYIYTPEITIEQTKNTIAKQVRFILEDKIR